MDSCNPIKDHIDTLANRLKEAYRVTEENNRVGRRRQKEQYDKGTKLTTFQSGDIVYLREMVRRKRACPKFRVRWKGPFTVIKRLSDLNYLVKVKRNKEIVVNVNKMKLCHQKTSCLPSRQSNELRKEVDKSNEERRLPTFNNQDVDNEDRNNECSLSRFVETPVESGDVIQEPIHRDQTTDIGREGRTRYWLRKRKTETEMEHDGDADSTVAADPSEQEAADVVSRTHSRSDVILDPKSTEDTKDGSPSRQISKDGQNELGDEPNQNCRYNLRPLPGRKLSHY
jgi:hypothetical protein